MVRSEYDNPSPDLGSADILLVRQIVDQFAPGLFGQIMALLAVMPYFARTEMEQTARKMACNECIGTSLAFFIIQQAIRASVAECLYNVHIQDITETLKFP